VNGVLSVTPVMLYGDAVKGGGTMSYKYNGARIKVVEQLEWEFSGLWEPCFDELAKHAPFFDGLQAYQLLTEESDSLLNRLQRRIGILNNESSSKVLDIAKGYVDDVSLMLTGCRNEEDFRSILFYCLNACDRLVKIVDRLEAEEPEYELAFPSHGAAQGERTQVYFVDSPFKLRAV